MELTRHAQPDVSTISDVRPPFQGQTIHSERRYTLYEPFFSPVSGVRGFFADHARSASSHQCHKRHVSPGRARVETWPAAPRCVQVDKGLQMVKETILPMLAPSHVAHKVHILEHHTDTETIAKAIADKAVELGAHSITLAHHHKGTLTVRFACGLTRGCTSMPSSCFRQPSRMPCISHCRRSCKPTLRKLTLHPLSYL